MSFINDNIFNWYPNTVNKNIFDTIDTEAGSAVWGAITGTITDQTDLSNALDDKVDIVAGKVLSDNNYTDAEKTKLSGVSENADVSGKITYATKTANYTLTLPDFNSGVEFNSASNLTLTIPTNTAVAFEVGTVIPIARLGAGTVTIAGASGVTVNSKDGALDIAGQYGEAVLRKVDTDTWILSGSLE